MDALSHCLETFMASAVNPPADAIALHGLELGLGAIELAPEAEEEKVCTIRTRRGAEVVEIPIPCTN